MQVGAPQLQPSQQPLQISSWCDVFVRAATNRAAAERKDGSRAKGCACGCRIACAAAHVHLNAVWQVERGEEAHAILMKDRVKLFVDMESEQECMTMRTIRSNSGGGSGACSMLTHERPSVSGGGGAGFGRSPGYASISSANRCRTKRAVASAGMCCPQVTHFFRRKQPPGICVEPEQPDVAADEHAERVGACDAQRMLKFLK